MGGVRETGSERNIRRGQVAGSPEKMGAGGVREEGIGRNMEKKLSNIAQHFLIGKTQRGGPRQEK